MSMVTIGVGCFSDLGCERDVFCHPRSTARPVHVFDLPIVPFYNNSILPTIVCSLPYLSHIFLTEGVTLVSWWGQMV